MLQSLIRNPIVIIGMHRSGTSMLAQILHRSGVFMGNDFIAYYESNYFQRLNIHLLKNIRATWDRPLPTQQLPAFNEQGFIREYLTLSRKPQYVLALLLQKRWGWKDPRNTYTLGSWLRLFPGIKVIHIVRNGIDTALSLYDRNMMLQPKTKWHSDRLVSLSSCFQLWDEYVQQAMHWKADLQERYLEVRYEDLIKHNDRAAKQIKEFTGVHVLDSINLIANKERAQKDMQAEMEELKLIASQNKTFAKLGYVA